MKSKLKYVLSAVVVFTLLFVFSGVFAIFSSAKNPNDYSRPGYSQSDYNEIFDSVRFLKEKLNVSLGDVERAYLTETSEFLLSYPKNIPSSYVKLYEIGQNLVVSPKIYSYTNDKAGTTISWVPTKVSCGDRTIDVTLSGGEYIASFAFDTITEGISFSIEYSAHISIAAEDINRELSRAYYDAQYLEYLERLLAYESALEIYNEYLSDKKVYEELYLEYTEYLGDLEAYEAALEKYEKYLLDMEKYDAEYVIYLESVKKGEELADEIAAYEAYIQKIDKINYRLSLVEDMKIKKTELKRSIFGAITGKAVDQVLAEESILTSDAVGVDKEIITGAGDATEAIRQFYEEYFALENDVEKYRYYQVNYTSLKDNFVKLFRALDKLYENNQVRSVIEMKERSDKFEILIAQLFYAVNALSDEPVYNYDGTSVFDSNYKIETTKGPKTPAQVLGDVEGYYVDRNMATPPKDEAYPVPVEKPDYTPVPEPIKPDKLAKPTKPAEIFEPEEPTPVEKPDEPAAVDNVNSITVSAPFEEGSVEKNLLEAYRRGSISKKLDCYLDEDYEMSPVINVTKVYGASSVVVTYHDYNNNHIDSVVTETGTFVEIDYVPKKPNSADGKFKYVFENWVDDNGNIVDLSSVDTDMLIYPKFREEINKFTVTWKVGDKLTTQSLPYGSTPTYSGTPAKAGDLNKRYVFTGWSPKITPVRCDVTYIAVFEEVATMPGLPSGSVSETADDEITVSCGSRLDEQIDISRLLALASGKYSVKFLLNAGVGARSSDDSYAEFTIPYSDVIAMNRNSVHYIKFSVGRTEGREDYLVSVYSKNGLEQGERYKISAAIPSAENDENMRIVYYENGEKLYQKSTYSDGKIRFNLNTGCHYSYVLETFASRISILPLGIDVSVDKTEAFEGEIVSVSYNLQPGIKFKSLYYLDEAGKRVTIENGNFVMPSGDVSVGIEFEKISYTVVFVSDGMEISSKKYFYGDTVEIPTGVSKVSDENYSYKFKHWSPAVTDVYSDARYEAVYEKTPIVKTDDGGLKISEGTLRLIVTALILLTVVLLGAVPSVIISIVMLIRRKRRGLSLLGKRKTH